MVCTVDDLRTEGFVLRRNLSSTERFHRAGKIFGVFFFAAFITVFVPFLHFILPPISLIVGGALAFGEYTAHGETLGGEFICPNCKKLMTFPHETEEWPRIQRCTGCSFTLSIDIQR